MTARYLVRARLSGEERASHVMGGTLAACQEMVQTVPPNSTAEIVRRRDGEVVSRHWRDQIGYQHIEYLDR